MQLLPLFVFVSLFYLKMHGFCKNEANFILTCFTFAEQVVSFLHVHCRLLAVQNYVCYNSLNFRTVVSCPDEASGIMMDADQEEGVDIQMSYQTIVTVVDKGLIDRVFESARCEESYCGTVIAGRGSGMHENKKLFNLALEPEKEILLVLTQEEHSEKIINQIEEAVNITAPGNGILFGINLRRAHGISG
ncbi:hypothetical protein SDC9_121000 [bioreactor metagenome]|uniref:Nitrogen regulatory protein P-II n=1 Tax=bioreactor metagenome TaxID=1076179 RepID=A0A645CAR3_9ZZZZ